MVMAALAIAPAATMAESMSLTEDKVIKPTGTISETSSYTSADAAAKKDLTITEAEKVLYALGSNKNLSFTGLDVFSINDNAVNTTSECGLITASGESSGVISMSNNNSVVLNNNDTLTSGKNMYGGVISSYVNGKYSDTQKATAVKIDNNGSVAITDNNYKSTAEIQSSSNDTVGGAVYVKHAGFSMSGNGDVTISDNSLSGIQYYYNGDTDDLRGTSANGGAIAINSCYAVWDGNDNLTVENNTASGAAARGGAVLVTAQEGAAGLTISNTTGTVKFAGNKADALKGYGRGGAISMDAARGTTIALSDNNIIEFSNNSCSGTQAGESDVPVGGGAIFTVTKSSLQLSDNKVVKFEGNKVVNTFVRSKSDDFALGGAIASNNASAVVSITGNDSVTFSGNGVTTETAEQARGGAIYSKGGTSIRDNGNVIFEKNFEKSGDSYRLRGLYAIGHTETALNLSARDSGTFEIKDSMYVEGNLELNNTYEGKSQSGKFVFSGKTTENDLNTIIAANTAEGEQVRLAKDEEIAASRTSEITGSITLNNGTLSLQDDAVLKATKLIIKEGATLEAVRTDDVAAVVFGISAEDAELLNPAATLDAALELEEGALVNLDGGNIDMGGKDLVLKGKLSVTLSGDMLGEDEIVLFSNVGNVENGEEIEVVVNGVTTTGNVIGNDVTVDIAGVPNVPEPTTATLSLLALAGLAARRRRK